MFALKDGLPGDDDLPPPPPEQPSAPRWRYAVRVYSVVATLALSAFALEHATTRASLATLLSFVAIAELDTTLTLASVCVSALVVACIHEPTPETGMATGAASALLGVAATLVVHRRVPLLTRTLVVVSTALVGWPSLPRTTLGVRFACAFALHFALVRRRGADVAAHAHLASVLWILSAPFPLIGCLVPVLLFIDLKAAERVALE